MHEQNCGEHPHETMFHAHLLLNIIVPPENEKCPPVGLVLGLAKTGTLARKRGP